MAEIFLQCFWVSKCWKGILSVGTTGQVFFLGQGKKWLDSPLGDCSQIRAKAKIRQIEKTKIRQTASSNFLINFHPKSPKEPKYMILSAGSNSVSVSGMQSPSGL